MQKHCLKKLITLDTSPGGPYLKGVGPVVDATKLQLSLPQININLDYKAGNSFLLVRPMKTERLTGREGVLLPDPMEGRFKRPRTEGDGNAGKF